MTDTNGSNAGTTRQDGDDLFASAENALSKMIWSKNHGSMAGRWYLMGAKKIVTELGDMV
jgi:hypothetical protein